MKGTGDKQENPLEEDSDWVESDDEKVGLRPSKKINFVICYPCDAGSGTPADNIFFKNVRECLNQKFFSGTGLSKLPEDLMNINELEPHAQLSLVTP